ncbi:MAG TPA: carboxypeptidase regulatory-like domain-containing protein [Thermoanaerobaculia bacterium]|nr:carboxypeptidase regulatory-like domain-containing protein [Thermoanaerobaculia bacterium]
MLLFVAALPAAAQPFRKLGELDLYLRGLTAGVTPLQVTAPKNTISGVRVVVASGGAELTAPQIEHALGGAFRVEADLSGPGLRAPVSLPDPGTPSNDPLILALPPLPTAGDYTLSNLRLTVNGRTAIDVVPSRVPVSIIEQILITSVKTRPLTLDEIKAKGIVLDQSSYLGFEFTMGLKLESKPVEISFPVVFDKRGVAIPQPLQPPPSPLRELAAPLPTIVPMLLEPADGGEAPTLRLPNGQQADVRIPSVLVIPGNVGYLKQFFSAQLFVANGAPGGTGLTLREVSGTIKLPAGADQVVGTADDPLALPTLDSGPQPKTMQITALGVDQKANTADDVLTLAPGEQGQAEFLIRGEKEGFHNLSFDIAATLDGLATGAVKVKGTAAGGVLVRNPYFDLSFAVPAVVRRAETFKMYITVNNISQSAANDVHLTLDASRMSGASLVSDATQVVPTIGARDSKTLEYTFVAERTGQVVATYLRFDTTNGSSGDLRFTMSVGERGIALSPDTLVLPAAVDNLPTGVVEAAMRVLGQAWSISNAPSGTLPSTVTRIDKSVATQKALALAEAGLRVGLGQPWADAVRDLLFDFHGGTPVDHGFDQLLRETEAGRGFARAVGNALTQPVAMAGGVVPYERTVAEVAASGPNFLSFAASGPVKLALRDGDNNVSTVVSDVFDDAHVESAVVVPAGASLFGIVPSAAVAPYTVEAIALASGSADFSITFPKNGAFVRATATGVNVSGGGKYRIVADPLRTDVALEIDATGDGTYETRQTLTTETLQPAGARLISATVIGPETLAGALPFGQHVAVLFDRVVDAKAAAVKTAYSMPSNEVFSAKRQLSGRLVFATIVQPEGPYIATTFSVSGMADSRGIVGPAGTAPMGSRLVDPGAVVTGRVINADGTGATGAVVTYTQNPILTCEPPLDDEIGLTALPVGNDGRFELRYVRQDQCGIPFRLVTLDPSSGAARQVSSSVRTAGEQIVLDIALFGKGSVTGVVRDLAGRPVAGANVSALSETDPQLGGTAVTNLDGVYTISGVAVGIVRITAGFGASVGRATGRLDRAGTTATINVTLDGGSVNFSGKLYRSERGVNTLLPGMQVVYKAIDNGAFVPIAVATTDGNGAFRFTGMPTGDYQVTAALNTRDRVEVGGVAAAGQSIARDLFINIMEGFGTVRGIVKLPNGAPAGDTVVSIDSSGVLTAADGRFELANVLVKPLVTQHINAITRDYRRSGRADVVVSQPNQLVDNVVITLSGLGSAELTVVDAAHQPLAGEEVDLLGACENPCGCSAKTTDSNGRVRYDNLPIGSASFRVTRQNAAVVDQAEVTLSIARDGETVFGILTLAGTGTVTGTVLDPDGKPAMGADIVLHSKVLDEDTCSLVSGVSHTTRTNELGQFRFTSVNVGSIAVTAAHPFFPTTAGAQGTIAKNGDTVDFTLHLTNTISGELSGTIYLPDGTTPAGAGVEVTANGVLPDVTVITDAAGHFRFAKIFPQGNYSLTARDAITGGVAQEQLFLRAAQDSIHDLRLKGRGSVTVRVVDGADQPVTSARVKIAELDFPNRTYEGVVDASSLGVATFDGIFEGRVSAEASDVFARGGRSTSVLARPGDTLEMKVALTTTGKVRGHFLRPDGTTAIPFGTIKLIANGRVLAQTTTLGSGDVGSFAFDYVPAGAVRLEAVDPLTARSGIAAGSIATEGETLTLDVLAQGLGVVQGVVTSNGAPMPAAHVEVVSGSYKANALADANGSYVVEGVPEGRVVVTASLDGSFLSGTASATLTGEATVLTLNVAMRDAGQVTGQVLRADGNNAAPLSVVTIQVGGTGGGTLATTTDDAGHFAFERVPAGLATLTAEVAGSVDKGRATADVAGNATTDVPIVLTGVGTVNGRALDSAGNPTAGTLTFSGTGSFPYTYVLTLGSDGIFNLREVLAGPYTATLKTQSGEFTLYGTASGTIAYDAATNVTVQLQPSGTVTGVVKRADGTTAAYGAQITLDLLPNRGSVTLQAGTDGRFTSRGVPLGAFSIRITDPLTGGVAIAGGFTLANNGDTVDAGTLVLDDSPFAVLTVDPANGAAGVAIDHAITLTFSDPLQSLGGISVKNGTSSLGLSASLASDGKQVTLTGTLPDSAELTVSATTAVTDIYGRHPLQAFESRFRTVDLSPPAVASIVPAAQAIQIDPASPVTVTFTEPLADATDIAALISISSAGGGVTGNAVKTAPAVVTFTPSSPLATNTRFTVTVSGAIDASGNRQTATYTTTFATLDTIAPSMTLRHPLADAWANAARPAIQIDVDDALSGIAINTATLSIDGVAVQQIGGSTQIYFLPAADLADGTHTLSAAVSDKAGNRSALSSSFSIDTQLPSAATVSGVTEGQKISGSVTLGGAATDSGSGVARIQLASGTSVFATTDATLSVAYDTTRLGEGPHELTARAVDVAGNIGPAGAPVHVIVDNSPLTVAITAPSANQRFRDSVTVKASVSEPVTKVDFTLGTTTVSDTASPYEATFDLAALADATQTISVTGTAYDTTTATVTRAIIVDRTPPAAPDVTKINAEPPSAGRSLVFARAGAVEASALVEITNTATAKLTTITAGADGGFSVYIDGAIDDLLSLAAVDSVGNRGAASTLRIRSTPSLPPSSGATTLSYEGILADRVGTAAGSVTPDGNLDAVFTMSMAIGDGVSRTLSYIDLAGPVTKSTRGGNAPLGVSVDVGSPLLNAPNGTISLPVTSGTTLTLFAANDNSFIRGEQTYTVTAVFTDGSRFVGSVTVEEEADHETVPHSAKFTASPATVIVTGSTPSNVQLTITDIRDIDGTLVPDHSHVALSAADMATKDPWGSQIRSSGGTITDGEPAANNPNFRVFEVVGGSITATYSTTNVTPSALFGAHAVIQAIAADHDNNVIGTEAIGSIDIDIRSSVDTAIVSAVPAVLYADRFDRRSHITVEVRNANGTPAPDGTRIFLAIGNCATTDPQGFCIGSYAQGQLIGGEDFGGIGKRLTVKNGIAECDYSSNGALATTGRVETVKLQVAAADANGNRVSSKAIALGNLQLTGAAMTELYATPDMTPYVFPVAQPVQIILRHAHDTRANLIPDGANLLLSATNCASIDRQGFCQGSEGGTIVDGVPSPTGSAFRMFSLGLGEIRATYSTLGATQTVSNQVRTAVVQALMADSAGNRADAKYIARANVRIIGPLNARGFANPSTIFADGSIYTTTVTFNHILDAYGNPLPDGTKMVVSAASCAATDANGFCVGSAGGQIIDGVASPTGSAFKTFTIQNGQIVVTYADQGLSVLPGQFRDATVVLMQGGPNGERLSSYVLGSVPIRLAGNTSATASITPTVLHADGGDYRAKVTFSNFRDSNGSEVPDGTLIAVSAASCAGTDANGFCVSSIGGAITDGAPSTVGSAWRTFAITNGQVVAEYSTNGIVVASGEQIATVIANPLDSNGNRLTSRVLATASVRLLAPASATVSTAPIDVSATGPSQLSQITISDVKDSDGVTRVPDGSKVGIGINSCSSTDRNGFCVSSVGGLITAAGTSAGDGAVSPNNGNFKIFTIAGGEVKAVYSTNGLTANIGETKVATVQVVPASTSGNIVITRVIGTAVVLLHGVTSTQASGPATLSRTSGATATVTFSAIKDSAGNPVPDGTVLAVTANSCGSTDANGFCNTSVGGTIVDGASSPSGSGWKVFTVSGGTITVTYSPGTAGAGRARIQVVPARPDATVIQTRSLNGGTWDIQLQ